jgi:hypothetical protein
MSATVIVESDSLAAWASLAGVVVGGLLTGGLGWLRIIYNERNQQRRGINRAADDLRAGARNLVIVVAAYGHSIEKLKSLIQGLQHLACYTPVHGDH